MMEFHNIPCWICFLAYAFPIQMKTSRVRSCNATVVRNLRAGKSATDHAVAIIRIFNRPLPVYYIVANLMA
jgi:hypothetical protein